MAPMRRWTSPSAKARSRSCSRPAAAPMRRAPRRRRLVPRGLPPSGGAGRRSQGRDDLQAVDLEDGLLVAVHQVDVELVDPHLGEPAELRDVVVDRAEDAEAVRDLVPDAPRVRRPDLPGVVVVIALA